MITCIYLHFVLLLCSSPVYKKYMKLYVKKFCSVLSCTRLYFCFQGSFATNAMVLCCVCSRKTLTWMFHDCLDLTHFFIAFTGAKRHAITWINVSPLSLFSLCRLSFLLSMHTFCRLPARTHKPLVVFTYLLWEELFSMPRAQTEGQTFFSKASFLCASSLRVLCEPQWSVPKCASRRF